jgi:hypothetical protein
MFILLAHNSVPLQFKGFVDDNPVPGNDGDCCTLTQSLVPLPNLETPQAVSMAFPEIAVVEDVVSDPVVHRYFPNLNAIEESISTSPPLVPPQAPLSPTMNFPEIVVVEEIVSDSVVGRGFPDIITGK